MEIDWKDPKIIIGNIAKGEFYYPRPELQEAILKQIQKGNHVLVAAPRRYGKSSIVLHLSENCPEGMNCIFKNIQGIKSENEFYKRLYELMILSLSKDKKLLRKLNIFFKGIGIEEIDPTGKIKFKEKQFNYLSEIDKVLPVLTKNKLKLVLFIDELPEVLHNLYKTEKIEEAKGILKNIRRWRQMDKDGSLCLVFTGSVGIHHVIKVIEGRVIDINDMSKVDFEPFSREQAIDYILHVTKDASVRYDEDLCTYLLTKISYPIPYFINLILDRINLNARKINNSQIGKSNIDKAFDDVIKPSDYFKDWKNRIFEYYDKNDALFMNEILLYIAHKGNIITRKIYDLAVKHDKTIDYMDFINDLLQDGYIVEIEGGKYDFVSPFLKEFWKKNQPIYNEE